MKQLHANSSQLCTSRFSGLRPRGALSAFRLAEGAFRLFAFVAALSAAASAGAITDREEMELAASGKVNVKKASSGGWYSEKPTASDTLFLNGWSTTIGQYLGYGNEIIIPIDIERFFGDKQKLIASGALPDHGELTLYAWDVDENTNPGRPEEDRVYFNGHYIGTLTGRDDAWRQNTFPVPIEFINLPTTAGGKAENIVRIEIDVYTKGDWLVQIDWAALEIPAAPPVIVSHGIEDNEKGMGDLVREIELLGLPVHAFDYQRQGYSSIQSGAFELKQQIDTWLENWNVDKVTIVAHSMGGLKARHYISEYDWEGRTVDRILQIATPNGGSDLAKAGGLANWGRIIWNIGTLDLWEAWSVWKPAFRDLTKENMAAYNATHPLSDNVKYFVLAGNCNPKWKHFWQNFNSKYRLIEFSEGDGAVSVESAHTMVPRLAGSAIQDIRATHGGLVMYNPPGGGQGMVHEVVHGYLKKKLVERRSSSGAGVCYPSSKSKMSPTLKRSTLSEEASAWSGASSIIMSGPKKASSQTTQIEFPIRKGNAAFVQLMIDGNDSTSLLLRAPNGSVISDSDDTTLIVNDGSSTIVVLANPVPGTWKLEFKTANSDGLWSVLVQEADSGIELNAELAAETVCVGNSFSVTMRPMVDGRTQTGLACSVIVLRPDKTSATYALRHTGGGVYSASIPASVEGIYPMLVQATIAGTTYSCDLYGTAYASSAMIGADAGSGPVDEDGNGMYDWLVARVGITGVDSSKEYRVLAELVDADGGHIEWASGTAEAGASYAELYFNGSHIFDYGRTAKYVITDVRLFEVGDDWEAQTDARSDWLELDGSSWARYEHELITIVGTGDDSVVRPSGATTGDLSVGLDVAFDASVSGSYDFSASLRAQGGTLVASAYGSATLTSSLAEGVDVRRVAMTFPGEDIVAAGLEGPWIVTDVLFWNSYHELSPEGEYETSVQTLSSLQSGYDLAFALTGKLVGDWPSAVYLSDTPSEKGSETPVRRSFLVGETIFPHVAFANVGTQGIPATPFNIRFRVEDEFGTVIATWNYNEDHAIGVNAFRYWFQYAWPGIQRLPVGRYTYTVALDTGDTVSESDETNNTVAIPFKVVTAIPPDNDDFVDAVPLFGAVAAARGSNVNATREDGEPIPMTQNIVSGSAWWSWTAPEDGDYCFSTEGSDFDTVLAVYTGDDWDTLEEVDSNDDFQEVRTSSLWITDIVAGTTYFVSVAGYNTQSGAIRLSIQPDIGCRTALESRIQEGADCYYLSFTTDDDTPWNGVGLSGAVGKDAVRSGLIGDSDLSLLATTLSGPGIMAFKWKVSCEQKFDTLEFYLDNERVPGTLSGVGGGWRYEAFKVTGSGDHPAIWLYGKDRSNSAGDDCGWIDQVVWVENSPLTPVYRFYSKTYKGHFFTTDRPERDSLILSNPNWNYEGAAFFTYENRAAGTVPAYRFYSKAYRGHFYTIDEQEMTSIRATNPNWRYEGVAYYVRSTPGAGTMPVYRFWSNAYRHHFFTTDEAEKDNLIATNPNWKYEGIAYYAWATPEEAAGAGVGTSSPKYAARPLSAADSVGAASSSEAKVAVFKTPDGATSTRNSDGEASSAGTASPAAVSATEAYSADVVLPSWTLAVLPDGIDIAPDETVLVDGLLIETRTEEPDDADVVDVSSAEDNDVVAFRFSPPEGTFAILFGCDGNILLDAQESEGPFDFTLPADGGWHWLHVLDAEKEEPFTLWIRAD